MNYCCYNDCNNVHVIEIVSHRDIEFDVKVKPNFKQISLTCDTNKVRQVLMQSF